MTEADYRKAEDELNKMELLISRIDTQLAEKKQEIQELQSASSKLRWGERKLSDQIYRLDQPFRAQRLRQQQREVSAEASMQSELKESDLEGVEGNEPEETQPPEVVDPCDLVYCGKLLSPLPTTTGIEDGNTLVFNLVKRDEAGVRDILLDATRVKDQQWALFVNGNEKGDWQNHGIMPLVNIQVVKKTYDHGPAEFYLGLIS
eukprot:Blabericola_migrator_1__5298@NODE_271_length_10510_cov_106_175333_g226_i0_p5_GENE_NODE_271_length_10510_cov_106_175333_g226_i0NODE_271_length_10510_cov_106_175333_g226_i0_p5_ORF_typecomplete_len204_score52_28Phage_HK97_TLTM/PF06120_11/0_013Laminin_I/PF06008_14/0_025PKcGMP_CC/PF16808_5/0_19SKA1/PF07160_12/0_11Yuri_gagarin/PF15934_5/0_19YabA/PF06156_13/0_31Meiotic_rec114/PF03525_14/0_51DUF3450/PF11932_8/0_74Spc24/PF08286_11/83UPF0242/PF06785_11/7_8VPS38/PF17649_1/14VPS38/PF17649_1/1_1e03_NODE_271_